MNEEEDITRTQRMKNEEEIRDNHKKGSVSKPAAINVEDNQLKFGGRSERMGRRSQGGEERTMENRERKNRINDSKKKKKKNKDKNSQLPGVPINSIITLTTEEDPTQGAAATCPATEWCRMLGGRCVAINLANAFNCDRVDSTCSRASKCRCCIGEGLAGGGNGGGGEAVSHVEVVPGNDDRWSYCPLTAWCGVPGRACVTANVANSFNCDAVTDECGDGCFCCVGGILGSSHVGDGGTGGPDGEALVDGLAAVSEYKGNKSTDIAEGGEGRGAKGNHGNDGAEEREMLVAGGAGGAWGEEGDRDASGSEKICGQNWKCAKRKGVCKWKGLGGCKRLENKCGGKDCHCCIDEDGESETDLYPFPDTLRM